MIPVGVRKDEMIMVRFFLNQSIPQSSNSRTRIHDDDRIILRPYFDAGRIAPVFLVFFARNRYRTSCTPATNNHYDTKILNLLSSTNYTGLKFEILNLKLETISKLIFPKPETIQMLQYSILLGYLVFLSLEFFSDFDIRV
jgi:hypothetical protein